MSNSVKKDSFSLPYDSLAQLGISRDMADSMPQLFKDRLLNGNITSLVKASIKYKNGTVISLPLKLQLVADKNGKNILMAYPVHRDLNNSLNLSQADIEKLKKGEIITRTIPLDGVTKSRMVQLDPETNSLCVGSVLKLDNAIKDFEKINDIQLGVNQKQQIREGRPVELSLDGETVCVGADLREPNGFKLFSGDMEQWNIRKQMEYDDVHPEYIGLVMTDKNRWEYQVCKDLKSGAKKNIEDQIRNSPRFKV